MSLEQVGRTGAGLPPNSVNSLWSECAEDPLCARLMGVLLLRDSQAFYSL